MLVNVGNILFA